MVGYSQWHVYRQNLNIEQVFLSIIVSMPMYNYTVKSFNIPLVEGDPTRAEPISLSVRFMFCDVQFYFQLYWHGIVMTINNKQLTCVSY